MSSGEFGPPTVWPPLDPLVERAMAKWPHVPDCYGWLALDRRGQWRIQGEIVRHAGAVAFLGRNYRADGDGRWYVQNGPQRVFVDLAYTPWIYRLASGPALTTHGGQVCPDIRAAYLDDEGSVLFATGLGIGVLDDRDLCAFESALHESAGGHYVWTAGNGRLTLVPIARAAVAAHFNFVPLPRAAP